MHYQFFLKRLCNRFLSGKVSSEKFCSTFKELSDKFNKPGMGGGTAYEMINFAILDKIVNDYLIDLNESRFKQTIEAHLNDGMFWD
ncbi:hypothetical protein [Paenibacillus daejeonensis]|uniref:hypothetical protein n=1 Tax=Paenibacillus daejeonensis TaxID=135193 RepID=UPI000362EAA2|nr:hypothetical protein [Paenibacillus daejeonensis]